MLEQKTKVSMLIQDLLREGRLSPAEAITLSIALETVDRAEIEERLGTMGLEGLDSLLTNQS